MRAGDYLPSRYHPTAMSNIIRKICFDCYWFVLSEIGRFNAPLHRECTINES